MTTSRKTTPSLPLPVNQFSENLASTVAAAEGCPLGLVYSENRCIQWCNDRFADMFGYSRKVLLGESFRILYPSEVEFQQIGQRGFKQMLDSGKYQDERLMRRKDGITQWFRVHGRALDMREPFRAVSWIFEPLVKGIEIGKLTPRQREILTAMTRGQTSKECAKELDLSPRTVEKIRATLREKFGANNAAALMSRIAGLPY